MKFGPVPMARAEGAILAHSVQTAGGKLPKGRVLSAQDVTVLLTGGLAEMTVARLEDGDLHEDAAAAQIAEALCGPGLSMDAAVTGRVFGVHGQQIFKYQITQTPNITKDNTNH